MFKKMLQKFGVGGPAVDTVLDDPRCHSGSPVSGEVIRAVARGELPADTDAVELVKTLVAPIYLRLLVTGEPIDETTADRAVEIVLAAAHAHALSP
ncbi:TetR/AcrR family transcriptional regulator C-terminal ligand-binding domain-containing protein [Amycolatopsis anabasis]|uniref:TetR/AcrR family transcriptional regulator C-terminal ligand-binding domain-containing protein n=1 Tax=Amycolatopsis anabasis TaxID=1840409 RepID=UPI001C54FF16|nr:TetR/AcrR family transcriptional regulator C-terminal ligand-binding domain-containing protein [Amycolatopsis anabasis]